MRTSLLGCLLPFLLTPGSNGQTVPRPDFSAEPFVFEHAESIHSLKADGTGSRLLINRVKIQSDAALRSLGVLSFPFASSSEHVQIDYVRVRRPDGTVVETSVEDAIEMPTPVTQQAPFYSDEKYEQLPIRSLRVGDTVEWKVTITRFKPEAANQSWGTESFIEGGVALEEVVELHVPRDLPVNVWSPSLKPVLSEQGTDKVYRWTTSQMKPTVGPAAEADKEAEKKRLLTPEEETEEKQGKLPAIAWTTFQSWGEVGAWYRGLEANRMEPDAAIKKKVDEITAGKATQEEKVQAIYGYVATQLRYIGVAFGTGRYQPHRAGEVLENQYGDCKDKHTLLAAMLQALGLHPDAVLIGEGIRFNEAVPSPASFNHLITRVNVGGQQIWLDATSEVAPYRVLLPAIRDHQALIVPDVGIAQVDRTPAELPFPAKFTLEAKGVLDSEGTSNSHMVLSVRGDEEVQLRALFRAQPTSTYTQMVQGMSQGMGYAGTVLHPEISAPDETANPFVVQYEYKREKSGDWDHYRIIPQVMPVGLPQLDLKDPPHRSVELGTVRTEESNAEIKLPEGWGAELPEAIHATCPYAALDQTYRVANGMVYTQRRLQVFKERVPLTDLKSYVVWADQASIGEERYIVLTRPMIKGAGKPAKSGASTNAPATGTTGGPNTTNALIEELDSPTEDAGSLIAKAYAAIMRQDYNAARDRLDMAKEKDPKHVLLWYTYGLYDAAKKDVSTACDDWQKEIDLHPDRLEAYPPLVEGLLYLKRKDAVVDTLRRWIAADDANPQPAIRLTFLLTSYNRPQDAIDVATAALRTTPETSKSRTQLQFQLGRAQILAGRKQEADATLIAVLKEADDAEMLNDAAYELADAGLELDLDSSSTVAALKKLDDETQSWTLDENASVLKSKSSLVTATWDTLGFIWAKQGKNAEAASYLRAAFINRTDATTARHYGDLLLARGDKRAALTVYEMGINATDARRTDEPVYQKLQATVTDMQHAGVKSELGDAQQSVANLRKISLGPARGLNGSWEYKLLIGKAGVLKAEAIGYPHIDNGEKRLVGQSLSGFVPPASDAHIVRYGYLNCHTGICEIVFEP